MSTNQSMESNFVKSVKALENCASQTQKLNQGLEVFVKKASELNETVGNLDMLTGDLSLGKQADKLTELAGKIKELKVFFDEKLPELKGALSYVGEELRAFKPDIAYSHEVLTEVMPTLMDFNKVTLGILDLQAKTNPFFEKDFDSMVTKIQNAQSSFAENMDVFKNTFEELDTRLGVLDWNISEANSQIENIKEKNSNFYKEITDNQNTFYKNIEKVLQERILSIEKSLTTAESLQRKAQADMMGRISNIEILLERLINERAAQYTKNDTASSHASAGVSSPQPEARFLPANELLSMKPPFTIRKYRWTKNYVFLVEEIIDGKFVGHSKKNGEFYRDGTLDPAKGPYELV